MKTTTSIDDVVARLKAEQELAASEAYQTRRERGDEWARNASLRQLRRLDRMFSDGWGVERNLAEMDDVAEGLAKGIDGDDADAAGFWGDDLELVSFDYARGFCEAALELWDAVKDWL